MLGLAKVASTHIALAVALTLLLALSTTPLGSYGTEARGPGAVVAWVAYSDPTEGDDRAYAVCEAGGYVYVVGAQGTEYGYSLRVEKRSKSDGSLVRVWSSANPGFRAYSADCAVAEGRLYVVHEGWGIAVFDLELNLLNHVGGSRSAVATSVALHGSYLYVAGYEFVEGGRTRWRVEKWVVEGPNLALAREYVSDPTPLGDEAMRVAVNPLTGHLWVVGSEGDGMFRAELLNQNLDLVKVVRRAGRWLAYAVDFDEEGYAYVSGDRFIAKYDAYGNEVLAWEGEDWWAPKLLYARGLLYVGANALCWGNTTAFLYIFDKDLRFIGSLCLRGELERWGGMAFDGRSIYVAGHDPLGWVTLSIVVDTSNVVLVTLTVTVTKTEVPLRPEAVPVVAVVALAVGVVLGASIRRGSGSRS